MSQQANGSGANLVPGRRYLRMLTPGILAGFAAGLTETPFFLRSAGGGGVPWTFALLAIAGTIFTSCVIGVAVALLFEMTFHLLVGGDPPPPLHDDSERAKAQRRAAVAYVLSAVICSVGLTVTIRALRNHVASLFFERFSSLSIAVIPATLPWWLVHVRLSNFFLKAMGGVPRLRRAAFLTGAALVVLSWAFVYRTFGGVPQVVRAAISIEAGLIVFALVWLVPHRHFRRATHVIGIMVLFCGGVLAIRGLPDPARALLQRSHGMFENLALRVSAPRHNLAIASLRHTLESAMRSGATCARLNNMWQASPGEESPSRPDIILVTVDSLRPDRMGCYGSKAGLTPNLDAFASDAWVLSNAFAPAPGTLLSLEQTMSGRPEHEVPHILLAATGIPIVDPGAQSIAALLYRIGYRTVALMGYPLLSHSPFIGQGFSVAETLLPSGRSMTGGLILDRTLAQFDRSEGRPLFVWSHIMDVHQWENEAVKTGFGRIASYERHVDLVDKEFGRFFVALNKTERGRNAVIIITADHGESLGEQGLFYHGFMAPATLRVPLIVRLPGQSRKQVAATVGLLDLAPTVLGMAGLRWPNLPGRDLRSLVAPDPSDRPVFHETLLRTSRMEMGVTGVTTYPWQLIYDYRYNILTLTNLENDPKGENNLAGQDLPAESALLRSLLDFYQRRCPS